MNDQREVVEPTFEVRFQPSGIAIRCRSDQTIAEAASQQGVTLALSCHNGICTICRAKLMKGRVSRHHGPVLQTNDNELLCCVTSPCSDIEIYMTDVYGPDQKPAVNYAFSVSKLETLTDEVVQIELLAPAGKSLDFLAGQYCMLHVDFPDGRTEALPYSIANAPGIDPRRLELHIAAASETASTVVDFVRNAAVVNVTLPAGGCFITPDTAKQWADRPMVFVASGTVFSQIKSLIEAVMIENPNQEIHFYWSNKNADGFYLADVPKQWSEQSSHFHYHPIVEKQAADWNGRAGWLYEVIHEDFDDLSQVQMFACGSPNMVYGTLDQLAKLGLTQENMHSDVFDYAPRD